MDELKPIQPLDFEKPIFEMRAKILELEDLSKRTGMDLNGQMAPLKQLLDQRTREIFEKLSPWDRVRLARHPSRPFTSDYIELLLTDFTEAFGDRAFGDDPAMVAGFGRLHGRPILVLGHRKGRDTKEKIACNFGCAHPEGYRKAKRMMKLAEKFRLPILTLINTPGAYPGIGAEERGQAYAIAENLMLMAELRVPIVSVVIGEGGSGGALGIGVGDRVLILEHAYYSVITPEGCAAILWKSADRAEQAAKALRLTAPDLLELGVVDAVVPEPLGGAHRHPREMAAILDRTITSEFDRLCAQPIEELLANRYDRFRAMGSLFASEPLRVEPTAEAAAEGEAQDSSEVAE